MWKGQEKPSSVTERKVFREEIAKGRRILTGGVLRGEGS